MTLAKRLEAGPGSRKLSDECLLAVGWTYEPKWRAHAWRSPGAKWTGFHDRPDPSQNLQDAVNWMVPKEWTAWRVDSRSRKQRFMAELSRLAPGDDSQEVYEVGHAGTPALALCAAGLRAFEAMKEMADG